jgi:diazepam-binding inhibitor (GABA receptor modulating acyl-CoA-binding protein)
MGVTYDPSEERMPSGDAFEEAQERVKKLASRPSNAELLDLYALFKQATQGDVKGSRPGMLDPRGRAKFDAWSARKGTSQAEAKARYVALVGDLVRKLG